MPSHSQAASDVVARCPASEIQGLVAEKLDGLSLRDFIGTDTDRPEFTFRVADQDVSARAGLTRLEYGEAIDDSASYIEPRELSHATAAAIEAEETAWKADGNSFDWRASFDELPKAAAEEIRTIVCVRIWEDARSAFETQMVESLTEALAERGISVA